MGERLEWGAVIGWWLGSRCNQQCGEQGVWAAAYGEHTLSNSDNNRQGATRIEVVEQSRTWARHQRLELSLGGTGTNSTSLLLVIRVHKRFELAGTSSHTLFTCSPGSELGHKIMCDGE